MADFISFIFSLGLFGVIIFLLFGGVFYLILRPLFLWYFKIYAIMSELQENNRLLREILDELKIKNIQTPSSQQPKEDYSKYMPN